MHQVNPRARLYKQYEHMFQCPICTQSMQLHQMRSLICTHNHCFDMARQGYFHLSRRAFKSKYEEQLFEARRHICHAGFFDPLYEALTDMLITYVQERERPLFLLDAGCGEGSHLHRLADSLAQGRQGAVVGVGLDLSKEAIRLAARAYSEQLWVVGDLANSPLATGQFDLILNMLSPANDAEFQRLLRSGGAVIKVMPDEDHLQEIRELVHGCDGAEKGRAHWQNRALEQITIDREQEQQPLRKISYRLPVALSDIQYLFKMTPLTWDMTEEQLNQQGISTALEHITFSFLIGMRQRES